MVRMLVEVEPLPWTPTAEDLAVIRAVRDWEHAHHAPMGFWYLASDTHLYWERLVRLVNGLVDRGMVQWDRSREYVGTCHAARSVCGGTR